MTLPDVDTFASFGGPKVNYSAVEDVTTDLDAVQVNGALCNVAMMTHTAIRAYRSYISAATTGAITDPTFAHDALWGNASAVKPVMARTSQGIFTCTWPATVQDEGTVLGQSATVHTLALRHGWLEPEAGAGPYFTQVTVSANVATLYVWDKTGAISDAVGLQFTLYVL